MDTTPPPKVKQQLRREQGFVCAVPDCDNPYFEYHHFDPPWRERQHHEPDGMVALCAEHHRKADAGAFTPEQVRHYKRDTAERAPEVKGRFDWLRHKIVLASGGVFYIDNVYDLAIGGQPAVWFTRDEEGYALLNVRMPQSGPSKRVVIEDNFWLERGNAFDVVCPPGGKSLEVLYTNGDRIRVAFEEIADHATFAKRHPNVAKPPFDLPITSVEIDLAIPGLGLSLHTGGINASRMSGVVVGQNYIGVNIGRIPSRQTFTKASGA